MLLVTSLGWNCESPPKGEGGQRRRWPVWEKRRGGRALNCPDSLILDLTGRSGIVPEVSVSGRGYRMMSPEDPVGGRACRNMRPDDPGARSSDHVSDLLAEEIGDNWDEIWFEHRWNLEDGQIRDLTHNDQPQSTIHNNDQFEPSNDSAITNPTFLKNSHK